MSADPATVFVIDDDISVREALRNLMRSVGLRVETFATAQEFLARPARDAPGCLVLDVRLPGLSGLDLQRRLAETHAGIPIVFITGHGDIPMSVQAMKAGAVEFLTKPFRDQDLLDAVQQAIERDRRERVREAEWQGLRARYASLSAREQQILHRILRGLLNKQIAAELGISEATVKLHRGRIMQKMQAQSLAHLVRMGDALRLASAAAAVPSRVPPA